MATALQDSTELFVSQLIESTAFNRVKAAIEVSARAGAQDAVVTEVKKNIFPLLAFALVGGALGSVVFRGPFGVAGAGFLAAWAGMKLMKK